MNKIQIFQNEQFGKVRIAMSESNELLFCLADVCNALGLSNPTSVKSRLKSNGIQLVDIQALNNNEGVIINKLGNTKATFINEANLYKCIFQSRKDCAEKFQDWVCDEVLPSIRKNGGYIATKQDDTPEEIMARALTIAQATLAKREERIKQLETDNQRQQVLIKQKDEEAKENAPKVLFANAVSTSHRSCLVAELAKILQQNGVNIGQNRLFAWMRENGYLCSKGQYYNQPTQKAMELGLFELKQTSITKPDGTVLVTTTTKVTGKGQVYFVNKFLGNAA